MTEHIAYSNPGDRHVVIQWRGDWYKLPFFLLEDIVDDCPGLQSWLLSNNLTWKTEAIPQIKEILKYQMQFMEAFKMYEVI